MMKRYEDEWNRHVSFMDQISIDARSACPMAAVDPELPREIWLMDLSSEPTSR
jgi:hypothetical protein